VADELGIRRIIFPVDASTFSARGVLMADIEHAFGRSGVRVRRQRRHLGAFLFESLSEARTARSRRHRIRQPASSRLSADLRYRARLLSSRSPGARLRSTEHGIGEVRRGFHTQHAQRFSLRQSRRCGRTRPPCGLRDRPNGPPADFGAKPVSADGAAAGSRRVYVDGQWRDIATWRRDAIAASLRISGPAIVEEDYTASLSAPGWSLTLGRDGHLVAARSSVA